MKDRRVRLHWVSPLPPQETDIAQYTRRILPALTERAEVVLWTDTLGWDKSLEDIAEVRVFDPFAPLQMDLRRKLGEDTGGMTEAIFLHIGNSWVFHSGILRLARSIPGVVVIHDLAIQEFLRDLVHNGRLDARTYTSAMTEYHGAAGRVAAQHILNQGPTPDQLDQMPMFEIALQNASAALCHTRSGFERVTASRMLPAYHAELPFLIDTEANATRALDGQFRLVQFGHIGPNRRLDSILEALAQVAPDLDFVFDIFGKLWDQDHIVAKAAALGIKKNLRFRGFAPEPELDAAISKAHLVFNLRYPTMGEASGSQLRIWNAAATAAVTDIGWYANIPDTCALKISFENEVSSLAETLRRLNADRKICARIGAAGRERLLKYHTPDRYAEAIIDCARCTEGDYRERLLVEASTDALRAVSANHRVLCGQSLSVAVGPR